LPEQSGVVGINRSYLDAIHPDFDIATIRVFAERQGKSGPPEGKLSVVANRARVMLRVVGGPADSHRIQGNIITLNTDTAASPRAPPYDETSLHDFRARLPEQPYVPV
jgi:hypothetical protein